MLSKTIHKAIYCDVEIISHSMPDRPPKLLSPGRLPSRPDPRSARRIHDLEAHCGPLITDRVRGREVLRGARLVALMDEVEHLLRWLPRLGREARQIQSQDLVPRRQEGVFLAGLQIGRADGLVQDHDG